MLNSIVKFVYFIVLLFVSSLLLHSCSESEQVPRSKRGSRSTQDSTNSESSGGLTLGSQRNIQPSNGEGRLKLNNPSTGSTDANKGTTTTAVPSRTSRASRAEIIKDVKYPGVVQAMLETMMNNYLKDTYQDSQMVSDEVLLQHNFNTANPEVIKELNSMAMAALFRISENYTININNRFGDTSKTIMYRSEVFGKE